MTALGPSEVFISGAFKDFELEQTRFFFFFSTMSAHPLFPTSLTARMICCVAPTTREPCYRACQISFSGVMEADPAFKKVMSVDTPCVAKNHGRSS